ncbi:hypothetical protein Pogu_0515 [Pyrobaculum oguniense TE7]|uniref:Uncharacterized protein n=1 Tax=Pyrobaculum oguniense (strain DSM 13380 / JCM 10595 / TE7) TaxID=698757 RepID=H6Q778_PYROT|nr:hypothetical protein Pogu_0515 [Pyrobaculum oguniense TE7]
MVGVEDLRGMAERRGIGEIEYAKIWKKAMGSFGALLREGGGYRAYVGRGGLSSLPSILGAPRRRAHSAPLKARRRL